MQISLSLSIAAQLRLGTSIYGIDALDPALVLDFDDEYYRANSAVSTFSDSITHSRAGNATMVDSDGLLKWAPHNLLTYSEQFDNAAWVKTDATVTSDTVAAPNITGTADTIEFTSIGASNVQSVVTNLDTTANYTFGVWLKTASENLDVRIGNVNAGIYEIKTITSEWQLFTVEQVPSSTSRFPRILAGASSSGTFYAWGAHLYRSDLGGMVDNPDRGDSYVPTTSAARYLPRRGHHVWDGSAWVNEGILHESEARTNLIPGSETIEQKDVSVTDQAYTLSFKAGSNIRSAISETLAVTATDVFVYDTTKDSDGGAWRKRTQHTSWYNETLNTATRGSRREFPAVAVIVAESTKVTIYDGDDPSLPMWMVVSGGSDKFFNTAGGGSITAISAKNGWLVGTSSTRSVSRLNFLTEEAYTGVGFGSYKVTAPIATFRNALVFPTYTVPPSLFSIASSIAYDLAMTVLPDAPIDPATGVPVPTIAVATDGGVSVIKDDGTVVDLTRSTDPMGAISFNEDGVLIFTNGSAPSTSARAWYYKPDQLTSDIALNIAVQSFVRPSTSDIADGTTPYLGDWYTGGEVVVSGNEAVGAPNNGGKLYRSYLSDFVDNPNHMANVTTSTYNTGWMVGDIKGAFLSDTDDTDLVGSGELVTNGTFDTDTSGWSTTGGTAAHDTGGDGGRVLLTNDGSSGNVRCGRSIGTVLAGQTIFATVDFELGTSSFAYLRVSANGVSGTTLKQVASSEASGKISFSYTSAVEQTVFIVLVGSAINGETVYFDNVSVKLADADRSVNNNGLIVNGTVTRTAVATGADLVAYSGFSSSNYLEQPYNSDLDFGTGDFCVMGWIALSSTGYGGVIHNSSEKTGTANNGICIFYSPTIIYGYISGSSLQVQGTRPTGGVWQHICFTRRSGVSHLYQNGALVSSVANTRSANPTDSTANLLVGGYYQTGVPIVASSNDKFSLLRISATAPSAEQIKKIYEDEKVLFQENAQATLYGTSDAVTALAHDSDTGLLHVGTSAGRSVFDGLRRIDNTTDAVTTAISASGGFILEQ